MTKVFSPDSHIVIQARQFGSVKLVGIGINKRDMITMKMAENNIRSLPPQINDFLPDLFSQNHLPWMWHALMSHVPKSEARINKDMPRSNLHMTAQAPDAKGFRRKDFYLRERTVHLINAILFISDHGPDSRR